MRGLRSPRRARRARSQAGFTDPGYLAAFLVAFGACLLPAFGPPGWLFVAWFRIDHGLAALPLAGVAAVGAALGRGTLALFVRGVATRFAPRRFRRLRATARWLRRRRAARSGAAAVFVVAPIPSGILFLAAGLARIPLAAPCALFFAGRLVTFTAYALLAGLFEERMRAWGAVGAASGETVLVEGLVIGAVVVAGAAWWSRRGARRRRRRGARATQGQ